MHRYLLRQAWASLLACALLAPAAVHAQSGFTATWTPVGPGAVLSPSYGAVTSRVSALALDPNDSTANTVYLGTAGGGVWKSTSAAGVLASVRFAPLTDTLPVFAPSSGAAPSLYIGAVSVQPAANGIVLAGTGDPNGVPGAPYGGGLLSSADGGTTWTLSTESNDGVNGKHLFAGLAAAGFAWSTTSPSLVVAAMTPSAQSAGASPAVSLSVPGLYYSNDAGTTWHMSTLLDGAAIVQQPVASAEPGNAATSVVWDAARGSFFAFVQFHGVYASNDGARWTRLTNQPGTALTAANCPANTGSSGSVACPVYRGTLAVQPVTGDLYALSVDASDDDGGLWQDVCNAGASGACATPAPVWSTRVDGGALEAGNGSTVIPQASYALSLSAAALPSGGTLLLAGTTDVFRCAFTAASPNACSWRNTTNAANACATPAQVAPAQHALAVATLTGGSAPLVLVGNDGGLWRSTDGIAETGAACAASDASHFDNLNAVLASGGSLAKTAGFAQHPSDPNTLLAGLGTIGTAATGTAQTVWPMVSSVGGTPLLDPNAPANWFATIGSGVDLKLCTAGSACTASDFAAPATVGSAQVGGDAALGNAPLLLDPAQTTNLLAGTCRVWRGSAQDGTLWTAANAISPAFDGSALPCSAQSALLHSLAAGGPSFNSSRLQNSGSTVLYAGMAGSLDGGGQLGGHVFVTRAAQNANSSTAWTDVTGSPVTNGLNASFNAGAYDVVLIADAHDTTGGTVYAAVQGISTAVAVAHLYRSVDFGAHWTNMSSNLPNAPVNTEVIDPNDANTVYVANDAGVYATQAIATCDTQACWSVLGAGLPNARVVALQAAAAMPTGDGRTGMLRAGTDGRGLWQLPLLTAVSPVQAALTLSATSLSFAAQAVGTESSAQSITVTSAGSAPLVFGTPALTGDFVEGDTCAEQTVAVGSTCVVHVQFTPGATGTRTGVLTIYANVPGGQATVALTGLGTAPAAVTLTPVALSFPPTTVNATSSAQSIAVANTGGMPASIGSVTVSGDFAIAANTCGATLPAQTACAVSLTFTPAAGGTRVGALTVVDSAGTQTGSLTGTGQLPPTDSLTPASLSFAQQAVGSGSAAQSVTLTNAGDQALPSVSVVATGDFTVVNGCGAAVAAHASCALNVQFVPTAIGTRTGTLTVSDAFRSQTVMLTGTGVAPAGVSLTPPALNFGAIGAGLAAAPQTVTLSNNGGLPLSITSVVLSSGFTLAGNTCGATLPVNAACTLQVVFAPTMAGVQTGTLLLTDNAPTHTQTVSLNGVGVDFTLDAAVPASATVSSGATASYALLLNSLPSLTGNVALACAGAPAHSVCTVAPSVASLGSATDITVTVQTGVTHALLVRPNLFPWQNAAAAFALVLLPCALSRRRRKFGLGAFVLLLTLNGCSAARIIPGDGSSTPSTPTPAGTYALTVSATSAGITHSVPLTLVVQ